MALTFCVGWNRLFFLWGVFIERSLSFPEVKDKVKVNPALLDLDLERPPQDLPYAEEPVAEDPLPKRESEALTREDPSVNAIEPPTQIPMSENISIQYSPAKVKTRNSSCQVAMFLM